MNLLAVICSMALQQWGTKSCKASAGWHWKKTHLTHLATSFERLLMLKVQLGTLTLAAARHMSATIRPATWVSNMLVVAKLKTFSRATFENMTMETIGSLWHYNRHFIAFSPYVYWFWGHCAKALGHCQFCCLGKVLMTIQIILQSTLYTHFKFFVKHLSSQNWLTPLVTCMQGCTHFFCKVLCRMRIRFFSLLIPVLAKASSKSKLIA